MGVNVSEERGGQGVALVSMHQTIAKAWRGLVQELCSLSHALCYVNRKSIKCQQEIQRYWK